MKSLDKKWCINTKEKVPLHLVRKEFWLVQVSQMAAMIGLRDHKGGQEYPYKQQEAPRPSQ